MKTNRIAGCIFKLTFILGLITLAIVGYRAWVLLGQSSEAERNLQAYVNGVRQLCRFLQERSHLPQSQPQFASFLREKEFPYLDLDRVKIKYGLSREEVRSRKLDHHEIVSWKQPIYLNSAKSVSEELDDAIDLWLKK